MTPPFIVCCLGPLYDCITKMQSYSLFPAPRGVISEPRLFVVLVVLSVISPTSGASFTCILCFLGYRISVAHVRVSLFFLEGIRMVFRSFLLVATKGRGVAVGISIDTAIHKPAPPKKKRVFYAPVLQFYRKPSETRPRPVTDQKLVTLDLRVFTSSPFWTSFFWDMWLPGLDLRVIVCMFGVFSSRNFFKKKPDGPLSSSDFWTMCTQKMPTMHIGSFVTIQSLQVQRNHVIGVSFLLGADPVTHLSVGPSTEKTQPISLRHSPCNTQDKKKNKTITILCQAVCFSYGCVFVQWVIYFPVVKEGLFWWRGWYENLWRDGNLLGFGLGLSWQARTQNQWCNPLPLFIWQTDDNSFYPGVEGLNRFW